MDKTPLLAALIGTLGGLVGGGVTTVANYAFGLETSRHERLLEIRGNTYVNWAEVRVLSREIEGLRYKANELRESDEPEELRKSDELTNKADQLELEYTRKGRTIMASIATYGQASVVRSIADWYRKDEKFRPCLKQLTESTIAEIKMQQQLTESMIAEIKMQQSMRTDLMSDEEQVSDEDMAILLLQCELNTTTKN